MTPEELASLHARAFAGQGRAWSAAEFTELLSSGPVFAVDGGQGFALGRVVAGEAELLTIATAPEARRQGIGARTLCTFEQEAMSGGAVRIFLEVAQDNRAAIALYLGAGYVEVARRAGYYRRPDGTRTDAIVMEKHAR